MPSSSIQVSSTCKADMTFLPCCLIALLPKALRLTQILFYQIFFFFSHRNRSDNVKINVLYDLVFLKHSDENLLPLQNQLTLRYVKFVLIVDALLHPSSVGSF